MVCLPLYIRIWLFLLFSLVADSAMSSLGLVLAVQYFLWPCIGLLFFLGLCDSCLTFLPMESLSPLYYWTMQL
jgi:hypothetical protein